MRLETKAIKGGILLGTFGLISFLAMMHFIFDSVSTVVDSEIIYFFLIACILNYLVSIGMSAFCLKSIRRGRNPKLMGLAYTFLSLLVFSMIFDIPYFIYDCSINPEHFSENLTMLWASPLYCFVMGSLPALVICIPFGLYLGDDLL
mgnify:FL=1